MIDLSVHVFITVIKPVEIHMFLLHDLGRTDPSVMVHTGVNRFDIQLPAVYAESLGILIGTYLLGIPDNPDLIPVPGPGVCMIIETTKKMKVFEQDPFNFLPVTPTFHCL